MTLQQAVKKFPELFEFDQGYRLRIAVYDSADAAQKGKEDVSKRVSSARSLFLAPFGPAGQSYYGLYTGPMTGFEAVLLKRAIEKAIPAGRGGSQVELLTVSKAPSP